MFQRGRVCLSLSRSCSAPPPRHTRFHVSRMRTQESGPGKSSLCAGRGRQQGLAPIDCACVWRVRRARSKKKRALVSPSPLRGDLLPSCVSSFRAATKRKGGAVWFVVDAADERGRFRTTLSSNEVAAAEADGFVRPRGRGTAVFWLLAWSGRRRRATRLGGGGASRRRRRFLLFAVKSRRHETAPRPMLPATLLPGLPTVRPAFVMSLSVARALSLSPRFARPRTPPPLSQNARANQISRKQFLPPIVRRPLQRVGAPPCSSA